MIRSIADHPSHVWGRRTGTGRGTRRARPSLARGTDGSAASTSQPASGHPSRAGQTPRHPTVTFVMTAIPRARSHPPGHHDHPSRAGQTIPGGFACHERATIPRARDRHRRHTLAGWVPGLRLSLLRYGVVGMPAHYCARVTHLTAGLLASMHPAAQPEGRTD